MAKKWLEINNQIVKDLTKRKDKYYQKKKSKNIVKIEPKTKIKIKNYKKKFINLERYRLKIWIREKSKNLIIKIWFDFFIYE